MNSFSIFILAMGLALTVSFAPRGEFYQVIDSHPHAIQELMPYVETAYQSGRLWVVRLRGDTPSSLAGSFRRLRGGEKSYRFLDRLQGQFRRGAPYIREKLRQVERDRIKQDVELFSAFETRKAGTPGNREAMDLVAQRLRAMGLDVSLSCYAPEICNVIAERSGHEKPSEVTVVMAHLDSVGEAHAGADDNASGVAALLEMGRILSATPLRKTLRLVVTNGEEDGLLGSVFYAKELERQGKLRDIGLLVNMDMIGYNQNGIIELETSPERESVARWMAELVLRYTSLTAKVTIGAWGSDHVPFLRRGVPAVLTIQNWDTKNPCYHQACDTPEKLNYAYITEVARLNTAAVLTKDLE